MAISFVNVGALTTGTGNISPALPSGLVSGDYCILYVETANEVVSTPANWSPIISPGNGVAGGATATKLTLFGRFYDGVWTAPTVTDPGDHAGARICAFRGVHPTAPFTARGTTVGSGTSRPSGGLVVGTGGSTVLVCGAAATSQLIGKTDGALAFTNVASDTIASGNGGSVRVDYSLNVAAGTISTDLLTYSVSVSDTLALGKVELKAAGPAAVIYATLPGLSSVGAIALTDEAYIAGAIPLFSGFAEGTVGLHVGGVFDLPGLSISADVEILPDVVPDIDIVGDLLLPFGVSFSALLSDGRSLTKATDPEFIATIPSLTRSLAVAGLDRSATVPSLNRTLQVL